MKDEDVRKSAIIAQYDEVKHQQQSEKPIPYGTYEHLHRAIFNQTKPNSVKKTFCYKTHRRYCNCHHPNCRSICFLYRVRS